MILEYIQENFIYLHPGYTVFNTVVFGIILGISILLIIKMFKYIKKDPADLMIRLAAGFLCLLTAAPARGENGAPRAKAPSQQRCDIRLQFQP
jgi:uncharacterized membrane protein